MKPANEYWFEIWQDGLMVASGSSRSLEATQREMTHYAAVYEQDGPIEIKCSEELL